MPTFTVDWMHEPEQWAVHLVPKFKGRGADALVIGALEGRSACWLRENILTAPLDRIVCVDPFQYKGICTESEREAKHFNATHDLAAIHKRFVQNIQGVRVTHFKMSSQAYFTSPTGRTATFNIIEIDGSHVGLQPLLDLTQAWTRLRLGGVIIMDDIIWGGVSECGISGHWPRAALDAFLTCCPNCKVLYRNIIAILEKTE